MATEVQILGPEVARSDEELAAILAEPGVDGAAVRQAHALFAQVALADDFPDFLTLPAYYLID